MMTQAPAESRTDPLGDRRNWWGWPRDTEGNPISPEERDHETDGGTVQDPNSRSQWLAHRILKRGADLLDPITLKEPPNRTIEACFAWLFDEDFDQDDHDPYALHTRNEAVPVSDPIEHVPKYHNGQFGSVEYSAFTKRWRVSEEFGYLCRGPIIANRPAEEFMAIVGMVLEVAGPFCDRYVSDRERDEILGRARTMKRAGEAHDVSIMAEVVRCLEEPNWD